MASAISSSVAVRSLSDASATALHLYDNLRVYPSDDEHITCYGKATEDGSDRVLVVMSPCTV